MSNLSAYTYKQLYRDHEGWLKRWLRRRLGCRHTAEDLTQDTFVRLLRGQHPPQLNEPRAYLARIAHGLVIDHARRRTLEQAYLASLASLPQQCAPSPEQRREIIDSLAHVDALLDGLKPRARDAFLLSRLEGLSHIEIAGRQGVSLSTVEKDISTALKHCYRALLEP